MDFVMFSLIFIITVFEKGLICNTQHICNNHLRKYVLKHPGQHALAANVHKRGYLIAIAPQVQL